MNERLICSNIFSSDRVEAANQASQITVTKNEKKPSFLRRSNTSVSTNSIYSQSANEKSNKRISFQENKDHPKTSFDFSKPHADQAKESGFKELKMQRISEERGGDLSFSSQSSRDREEPLNEVITDIKVPHERKRAFLVSQLGVDNPTFHDETSSYVLDTLTLTTNRLNSQDVCEKL